MNRLICGIGVNDAGYKTTKKVQTGRYTKAGRKEYEITWECPYYIRWKSMVTRCYSPRVIEKRPTYSLCEVCEDWLTFSNFRKWMVTQDWKGKQLDKDLLFQGNKTYSPSTCVFVSRKVNTFLIEANRSRGKYFIGVSLGVKCNRYLAYCSNPFTSTGISEYKGSFSYETEAHLAWKKQKHKHASQLANSEYVTDERVAEALRKRYKNYTIVEEHLSWQYQLKQI
jgi:hypothetical protein